MKLPSLKIGNVQVSLPLVQGGMAVRISLAPLAAAVANEGGIGVIGASGMHPPELVEHIREARKLTNGTIGVNVMVAVREFADLVKAAIQEKVDVVISGAGFSRDVFKWCREADIPFLPIVSSPRVARLAERFGAAGVVVEGEEAGGHLGTDKPLLAILPEIIQSVKIPVIAAGGILKGSDIVKVLTMGASGVQMGTRFALSRECSAAPAWKEMCLRAKKPDDVKIIESPVGMPFRAIFSPFVKALMEGNVPKPGRDILVRCRKCLKDCKKNYCIIDALEKAQQGDTQKGLFTIGERVTEIGEILSVKEIIGNLLREIKEATLGVKTACSEGL